MHTQMYLHLDKIIFVTELYKYACVIYIYKTTILKIKLIARVEKESDYKVHLTSFTNVES